MMLNNSKKYEALAPAKINLFLDVLSKMENGYHNINSIMQSVSLFDKVTLEVSSIEGDNIIEIKTSSELIPNDKSNIVYKVASAILNECNVTNLHCIFTIEKNIPVCAGMAGGSSDGAASMKLLNEALGFPLTQEQLCSIGAKIGADIPFCLTGKTAICQGIGEKITPISHLSDVFIVCGIDNSNVSTPVAFKMLDEKYGTSCLPSGNLEKMVEAISHKNLELIGNLLFNKFESVIVPNNKTVQTIKDIMLKNGALGALMSGSGPSVFGIFYDEISQINAYNQLKSSSIRAFLCKTI